MVVWLSAWPWAGITSSKDRGAEDEGSVSALCKVAILAVVPWHCPGRADGGGDTSRPSVLCGLLFILSLELHRASEFVLFQVPEGSRQSLCPDQQQASLYSILAEGFGDSVVEGADCCCGRHGHEPGRSRSEGEASD